MEDVVALGATAFVIGLTGAMAPGPLLTVTIAETARRGRLAGISLMIGHAALEALLLIGFAFGLQAVLRRQVVITAVGVIGGAFLVWMGATLLWGALRGTLRMESPEDVPPSKVGPVLRGASVSLSNPYWTLWWATIGVTLAVKGLQMGPAGVAAFFIGHELADITWYGAVVLTVHSGRHLLEGTAYRIVMGVCAAFLVYLGGSFVWAGLAGAVVL